MSVCLVIGGAGFLGTYLVKLLLQHQLDGKFVYAQVRVLDRTEIALALIDKAHQSRLLSYVGDITNPLSLGEPFVGVDTVFHLASVVDVGLKLNPMLQQVNVQGTRNVVAACQAAKVKRLIYTSSEDVVLCSTPRHLATEAEVDYSAKPINDYCRTKIEAERVALAANGVQNLVSTALRPQHLYGPYDPHAIKQGVLAVKTGQLKFRLGDGSARFGIVYVENVAWAHVLAADAIRQHKDDPRQAPAGQAYFIGEDNAVNFFDFIAPFAAAHGLRMPRYHIPYPILFLVALLMELLHHVLAVFRVRFEPLFHRFHCYVICRDFNFRHDKARRDFGYEPRVPPAEGRRRTVEWFSGQKI